MNKKAKHRRDDHARHRPSPASKKSASRPGALRGKPGKKSPIEDTPVIAVGASAGGLEAFTQLLSVLPANCGMALVLLQHLDPRHETFLGEILARTTPLHVCEVRDGMRPAPDHVYVIPARATVTIERGAFRLQPRETSGAAATVDTFFESLARDRGAHAIAVVLSGTSADGARGLKAIKAAGGTTYAQAPESAKYEVMPRAAIDAGVVDFVLTPDKIVQDLLTRAAPGKRDERPKKKPAAGGNEGEELKRVLEHLEKATEVEFGHYKLSTLRRRILRRMALLRLEHMGEYLELLEARPEESKALYQDILIHVTEFFRDPRAFAAFKSRILPELMKQRDPKHPLRIWVPGCATGEEAYSMAISCIEALGEEALSLTSPGAPAALQIFATDVSEDVVQKARVGFYSGAACAHLARERLARFFTPVEGGFRINKFVRDLCLFVRHDATNDPPFAKLDLISCRNVLIYFGPILQKRVIPVFHYALNPNGYLWLGRSETISGYSTLFAMIDKTNKIYQKKPVPTPMRFKFPASPDKKLTPRKIEPKGTLDVQGEVDRIIMAKYAPAAVLVNEEMEILQFRGHTGAYIDPSPGQANLNLMKMARQSLLPDLRRAIQAAKVNDTWAKKENVRFEIDGRERAIGIKVVPVRGQAERYFLILFEEPHGKEAPERAAAKPAARRGAKNKSSSAPAQLVETQRELDETREYLQSLIEEHDATTEELTYANEEIQSSNEELQSTNEELETAKEELQLANEELTTVNEELQGRNLELTLVNNDLVNLLSSSDIPIVMLDYERRIRRFTPKAAKTLNLIASDVGRPIGDIKPNFSAPDLDQLVVEVLETMSSRECEVQDRRGRWYRLQIRPYRTTENKIDGAVIALVDIDALKRGIASVKEARDYAAAIVESVPLPLLILDRGLKVKSANSAFYELFGVKEEQIENRPLGEICDGRLQEPGLKQKLTATFAGTLFSGVEIEIQLPSKGKRVLSLTGRRMHWGGSWSQVALLALEDITEARRAAETLQQEKDFVQLLHDLSTSLAETHAIEDAVRIGLAEVCRHNAWPVGHAYLPFFDSRAPMSFWHLAAGRELEGFRRASEALDPRREGLVARVLETGKPLWITDLERDPVFLQKRAAAAASLQSAFCVPLMAQDRTVGALEFYSTEPTWPEPKMLTVLLNIGSQLGRMIERKQAEQEVRESEARFRSLADTAPVLIWMAGEDRAATYFNQIWLQFTGRSLHDELGTGWLAHVHEGDRDQCREIYDRAYAARQRFAMEYRLKREDGEYRWMVDTGVPRYRLDGTFLGYIGSCLDITERRTSEEKARDAVRARDEFLSIASHELKTPLTSLKLQLDILRRRVIKPDGAPDDKLGRTLGSADRQIERLTRLIDDLLDLSRIKGGRLALEPEDLDLVQLTYDVVERFSDQLASAHYAVSIEAPAPVLGQWDKFRIEQVIINLLTNAIKYGASRPIDIAVENVDARACFRIRDRGMGIAPADQVKIFDRYERAGSSRHISGLGVGLFIVRELVHAHRGRVSVKSAPGEGAIFVVELPKAPFADRDATVAPLASGASTAPLAGDASHTTPTDDSSSL